ncbi:uncharacterized protein EAE97_008443 [Botrytis byssoidea]|uniref:Uncharacterized protein n=1 Tax=Botrytis byssoidea TaxID=139641 RepID=A0A9P5I9J8_9HELO|nr:uncharacterized protein EAE97_008443 [Botrytis byssoidea]KAF7934083.1 hypothetical protein EAE97_008443 [Botrytis byssoidea]
MPKLQKGGENKIAFKKCAFAKNLKILAKAFEPFVQELSNDLEIQALLKKLDSQDLHPKGLEDSRYQHSSSDASDKLQVLFEEFPGTSSVFFIGTSSNPGLTIPLEDLQKLAAGSWISDTVVDAVMHLYHEKKPRDLYLLSSSNLEIFNSEPKEIKKGLCKIVLYVKAFRSHWTTQLAQITTPVGPKATISINIKVWDSPDTRHTPTLDFQRWLTEVLMLEQDPRQSSVQYKE